MNKTLIAAAVSAAVMAPVAAQAEATVYGRIHNGIEILDNDGGSNNTDVASISSRFGIKASSDLGNGLTASAQYEFSTTTDRKKPNISALRVGKVGISGGFGSIDIGNQWSAFYDTVGTHIDPTYVIGSPLYSGFAGAPYRASNTIKYSNSFGPVYLEVDYRINESGEAGDVAEKINGDGFGVGVSIAAGENLTLAAAVDTEEGDAGAPDTDRVGLAAKGSFGKWWVTLGWHEMEKGSASADHTQLWAGTSIGDSTSIALGVGNADKNAGTEPSQTSFLAYHNLGGGYQLMYEGASYDADGAADKNDYVRHVFGMRLDF